MLKFLGKKTLTVGKEVASDFLTDPDNFKMNTKRRLTDAGFDIAETALQKVKSKMTGSGRRRKRRKAKKTIGKRKKRKTVKKKKVAPKRKRKSNAVFKI